MESTDTVVLKVTVCYAKAAQVWERKVDLPAGSTVADALAASGFAADFPGLDPLTSGVGIFGVTCTPASPLHDEDRVEIYRPLVFDPMESRRRRARHKAARGTK